MTRTNERKILPLIVLGSILAASGFPYPVAASVIPCVGDCDGNDKVAINELIVGVNIALGHQPVNACLAQLPQLGDGEEFLRR